MREKGGSGIKANSWGSCVEHEGRVEERNLQYWQTEKSLHRPEHSVGMFKCFDVGYAKYILSPCPTTPFPSQKSRLLTHCPGKVNSIREPQWRAEVFDCELAFDKNRKKLCVCRELWGPADICVTMEGPGYKGQRDPDLTHVTLSCLCNQRQVTAVLWSYTFSTVKWQ